MSKLDSLRATLADDEPHCGYDRHMAFDFKHRETSRGHTAIEVDVDARFHNPNDVAHGGLVAGLADSAMGSAMFTILSDDETCTNTDLDIRFFRPVTEGRLRAEGSIIKEGRTICVAEARVTDAEGRLVAKGESSFLRMAGP